MELDKDCDMGSKTLSEAQMSFCCENGYLIHEDILDSATLTMLKTITDENIASAKFYS